MTAGLRKRHKKSVSTASTARYVFLFTCLCILRLRPSISRYYNNILLRLLPPSLDYDDQQHIITDLHDAEQNIVPINNIQKQNALNIRYIFGHSTGHSGVEQQHFTRFYPIRMVVHGIIILQYYYLKLNGLHPVKRSGLMKG